jgi:DNA-binding IclR family transcriptional regulator
MRRTIYDSGGLPARTAKTITDPGQLEEQLTRFREQGYAIDIEEYEIGVNGIAVWIVDGLGEVAAAISVSGHASRMTESVMRKIAPDVVEAARLVSVAIGGGDLVDSQNTASKR